MQGLWPTEHKCHLQYAIFTISLKVWLYRVSQKEVPTSDQQQSKKPRQTPAIPPSRAKPRPIQTQRSRPPKPDQNRARNTSPSANLMHQPTSPDPGSPDPKTQASQSPGQDKGTRNSTKVSRSSTDQTPENLSMDTRHIKVPHKL